MFNVLTNTIVTVFTSTCTLITLMFSSVGVHWEATHIGLVTIYIIACASYQTNWEKGFN